MKIKMFVMLAVMCVAVSANVANADVMPIGSSMSEWGTLCSDVEQSAYYHKYFGGGDVINDGRAVRSRSWDSTNRVVSDTWEYRLSLLNGYLTRTLGSNRMGTVIGDVGALYNSVYPVGKIEYGSQPGQSLNNETSNTGGSNKRGTHIYGCAAKPLKGSPIDSGVAKQLFRNRASTANILTSGASGLNDDQDHYWQYDAKNDTFKTKMNGSMIDHTNGITDQNTGIYAFITGFNYSANSAYQFLNGTFSELGTLVGIYINGFKLTDNYLKLSEDYLASDLFGSYDMEIDLGKLYANGLLKSGNNNLAFIIDTVIPEFNGGSSHNGHKDGLIAFTSSLNKNTNSIFGSSGGDDGGELIDVGDGDGDGGGSGGDIGGGGEGTGTTPEPATLLIVGIGLAGLGIRRKLMGKKIE
ncbi:MAG: PEP-CTERM sorting domain-containing protein [Planctomycetaceae bacterium]|jgi:hypothetical protein|nr:PEP-CTERM sorting domain-containing protein [Planctomycetaceae bacterium]